MVRRKEPCQRWRGWARHGDPGIARDRGGVEWDGVSRLPSRSCRNKGRYQIGRYGVIAPRAWEWSLMIAAGCMFLATFIVPAALDGVMRLGEGVSLPTVSYPWWGWIAAESRDLPMKATRPPSGRVARTSCCPRPLHRPARRPRAHPAGRGARPPMSELPPRLPPRSPSLSLSPLPPTSAEMIGVILVPVAAMRMGLVSLATCSQSRRGSASCRPKHGGLRCH